MSSYQHKKIGKKVTLKYLTNSTEINHLDLEVSNIGFQHISPKSSYPTNIDGVHPPAYFFNTEKGRTLPEFQLLYITHGKGVFASTSCSKLNVRQGNLIIIFPNEWHTYWPDETTGWDEYWIGFKGSCELLRQENLISKQHPILEVGINSEMVALYKKALEVAVEQKTYFQVLLAGIVQHLLSISIYLDQNANNYTSHNTELIQQSKMLIMEHLYTNLDIQAIAKKLNLSYSIFRKLFKKHTGYSPAQYMHEQKLDKAKELLAYTNTAVKEVSFTIGFENADYFCSAFKKKTGMSPLQFRKLSRNESYNQNFNLE